MFNPNKQNSYISKQTVVLMHRDLTPRELLKREIEIARIWYTFKLLCCTLR